EPEEVEAAVARDDPDGAPRRYGDEISVCDRERLVPDVERTRSREHLPHRRSDLAPERRAGPRPEPVHLRPECRERIRARGRIHETDRAVPGLHGPRVPVAVELELRVERSVRVFPAIRDEWRR